VKKGFIVCRKLCIREHQGPGMRNGGVATNKNAATGVTNNWDVERKGGRVVTKCMLDDCGREI
jgi:hypothetical protein